MNLMTVKAKISNINLKLGLDENVPATFVSDPNRIRQILLNFLSNALKFTLYGEIILKCEYEDDKLFFSVQDTGIGMNQQQVNQIFIPFNKGRKKTRRRYNQQGCGLGLVISYKMA